jgi:hypothetical protein
MYLLLPMPLGKVGFLKLVDPEGFEPSSLERRRLVAVPSLHARLSGADRAIVPECAVARPRFGESDVANALRHIERRRTEHRHDLQVFGAGKRFGERWVDHDLRRRPAGHRRRRSRLPRRQEIHAACWCQCPSGLWRWTALFELTHFRSRPSEQYCPHRGKKAITYQ